MLGIEVRVDGIAMSIAKAVKQKAQIESCHFLECNAAERQKVLSEFVSEHGLTGALTRLVLPADQYKVYPIEKPKVEVNELAEAARWKIKDLIDFDIADAVTDVYDFPADALRGRPEQINVVASRSALIKNAVDLVNACDLALESIDISELAIRNVAAKIDEPDRAASILYLRHGSGMIVLVKGDMLYFSRSFDFSLEALNDVSRQDSVIQQLALEIQRSFDYFESQLGQVPPSMVYLVGPAPNMPLANMLGGGIAARVQNLDFSEVMGEEFELGGNEIQAFVALSAVLREGAV